MKRDFSKIDRMHFDSVAFSNIFVTGLHFHQVCDTTGRMWSENGARRWKMTWRWKTSSWKKLSNCFLHLRGTEVILFCLLWLKWIFNGVWFFDFAEGSFFYFLREKVYCEVFILKLTRGRCFDFVELIRLGTWWKKFWCYGWTLIIQSVYDVLSERGV